MAVRAVLIVLALAVVGAFATPPYAGFGPHLVLPGNLRERLEVRMPVVAKKRLRLWVFFYLPWRLSGGKRGAVLC